MEKNITLVNELREKVKAGLTQTEIMKTMKVSSGKYWELYGTLVQQDNVAYKVPPGEKALRLLKVSSSGISISSARIKALKLAEAFVAGKSLKAENTDGKLTLSVVSAG